MRKNALANFGSLAVGIFLMPDGSVRFDVAGRGGEYRQSRATGADAEFLKQRGENRSFDCPNACVHNDKAEP